MRVPPEIPFLIVRVPVPPEIVPPVFVIKPVKSTVWFPRVIVSLFVVVPVTERPLFPVLRLPDEIVRSPLTFIPEVAVYVPPPFMVRFAP